MHAAHLILSHRFGVASRRFAVVTSDGVRIAGGRLGDAAGDRPALVLAHGMWGWHRKPRVARLAEALAARFDVYAFDLRGHGRSGGACTYGDREVEDVEAVVRLARGDGRRAVATVGASLGAIAVIRHAALFGGVDGVAAISPLVRWDDHRSDSLAWRRMRALWASERGRGVSRAVLGARLAPDRDAPRPPEALVGSIAPVPLTIVHDRDDRLFPEEEACRLYRAAGRPKRLLLGARFGHAEDGFGPRFAGSLGDRLLDDLGVGWSG
jgi:pimeloyl-ACP methyl ester carboxylesterase